MELAFIQQKIHEIRGHKVMLDFDLADLYDIQTKVFKQAVKRNLKRFPSDFMFELTKQEFVNLRSQFVTSSWGGTRYLPFAFTEQGVAMLSSVLGSDKVSLKLQRTRRPGKELASDKQIKRTKSTGQNNLRPQSVRPQAFFQSDDQVLSCPCAGSTIQVTPVFHTICQNLNNCRSIDYLNHAPDGQSHRGTEFLKSETWPKLHTRNPHQPPRPAHPHIPYLKAPPLPAARPAPQHPISPASDAA